MAKYTPLRAVQNEVRSLREFDGNNIWARWEVPRTVYVVYSYGGHWPLAVWLQRHKQWFRNDDRYSRTTSKHRSALGLSDSEVVSCSVDQLQIIKATALNIALVDNYIGDDIKAAVGFSPILKAMDKRNPSFLQQEPVSGLEPAIA